MVQKYEMFFDSEISINIKPKVCNFSIIYAILDYERNHIALMSQNLSSDLPGYPISLE